MVYQWGRVGIVVDENCPAFQELFDEYEFMYETEIKKAREYIREELEKVMELKSKLPRRELYICPKCGFRAYYLK